MSSSKTTLACLGMCASKQSSSWTHESPSAWTLLSNIILLSVYLPITPVNLHHNIPHNIPKLHIKGDTLFKCHRLTFHMQWFFSYSSGGYAVHLSQSLIQQLQVPIISSKGCQDAIGSSHKGVQLCPQEVTMLYGMWAWHYRASIMLFIGIDEYFDDLAQECSDFFANALELL